MVVRQPVFAGSSWPAQQRDHRHDRLSVPWERFTVAAKIGHPARLVTYNAGVNETFLYTTHQDYWAGELVNLDTPAKGRYLDNGLQWFGWTCLEDRAWVHIDSTRRFRHRCTPTNRCSVTFEPVTSTWLR